MVDSPEIAGWRPQQKCSQHSCESANSGKCREGGREESLAPGLGAGALCAVHHY